MKVYASLCVMVLLFHLAVSTEDSPTQVGMSPQSCCFTYTPRKIPLSLVSSYYETSRQCSMPGIVFVTTRGRKLCADPEAEWVQAYVSQLEQN